MERLQIAPIRPLDDFILQTDRFKVSVFIISTRSRSHGNVSCNHFSSLFFSFQLPDFNDLNKLNNRMTGNLLYYQTNYLISIIFIFTVISFCAPGKLVIGLLSLATATAVFLYLKKNRPAVEAFETAHPALTVVGIFIFGYFAVYMMDAVAVFLMATLFPILLIFIHSALRQRNFKNKINDTMESFGIKKTPMGVVLDFLGQELDKID